MFKCDIPDCSYTSTTKSNLKRHKMYIHNVDVVIYKCDVNDCSSKFKSNAHLKSHKSFVHDIDVILYPCNIENCNCTFKTNSALKDHKTRIHGINIQWVLCTITGCTSKFKTNSDLKIHNSKKHNLNIQWYVCNVEGCTIKTKSSSHLKNHKFRKHENNIQWILCDEKNCVEKFKTNSDVKQHKARKHDINVQWSLCTECDSKFKTNAELKVHCLHKHNNIMTYICTYEDCSSRFKSNSNLKAHIKRIHIQDIKYVYCVEDECISKFITNTELKTHLSHFHDIGTHKCEICLCNRNSSIEWVDNHKNKIKLCRICYNKSTGKNSSKEKQMSEYLDEIEEIKPFLIGSDRSFKSLGGCSLKRPDKMYISQDIALIIECDEDQHASNSYSCDEKRISDLYDEFDGQKLVVIRWNPDNYKPVIGRKIIRKNRLLALKELILNILKNQPKDIIYIYYMYYDKTNTSIANNIPHELLY